MLKTAKSDAKDVGMETNTEPINRRSPVWWERNWLWCVIGFLLLLLVFVFFTRSTFISIHPGERGVFWRRFGFGFVGGTAPEAFGEGFWVILPWNIMYIYDVRRQKMADQNLMRSADGLVISVSWACRFYPNEEYLPKLHQEFGPDYPEKLVRPEVISAIRKVVSGKKTSDIYSKEKRDEILREIRTEFNNRESERAERESKVSVDGPQDPASKTNGAKETNGVQYVQIDPILLETLDISNIDILKWRGIEATMELVKSPNSKIIVIGTDSKGLPITLNTDRWSELTLPSAEQKAAK